MKKFIYFIIVLFMACLVVTIAYAELVIDIEAHIDGRDQLIINRNTAAVAPFRFCSCRSSHRCKFTYNHLYDREWVDRERVGVAS